MPNQPHERLLVLYADDRRESARNNTLQSQDVVDGLAHIALFSRMGNKYQIDVIACSVAALGNRLNRNIILSKNICRGSQNTTAVGNHKTDVVLRMEVLNGKDRQLVGARASDQLA